MATTFILKSKTFGKKFDAMKGKFKGAGYGELVDGEVIQDAAEKVSKNLPTKSTAKKAVEQVGKKGLKKSKVAFAVGAGLTTAGAVTGGVMALKKKNKKKD